ncbi:ribonuclease E/G-like protein, chloroplastic isoform X2 [Diospyros lotus]|nr:ribonuclease E/G-like protein, chloroplastic isoform X2 [Diospyros lotus]XP_052195375.1 ribonuclease E/G-like protein, chloroplastic isoform X2 [Diospyros lotus]
MLPSCDTLLRVRPEFSLSVPPPGKRYRKIMVMDSWMRFYAKKSRAQLMGSRMEETYFPLEPFMLYPARDNGQILKCFKSDSLVSKQLSSDINVESEIYTKNTDAATNKVSDFKNKVSEIDGPVEEPWLLHSSLQSHYAAHSNGSNGLTGEHGIVQHHNGDCLGAHSSDLPILKAQSHSKCKDTSISINDECNHYRTVSERDQPVEEPWLFESCLFLQSAEAVSHKETVEDEGALPKLNAQNHEATENLVLEEASKAAIQDDLVPTIILVNSSLCTMQRIAVLEDGKLVELLLEPVKNNVQCDSVYLGVVTKLVPHMGGAFVNIGSPRLSLMDIKNSREPFIFPPFRQSTKKKKVNDSMFAMLEEPLGTEENEINLHGAEVIDEIEDDESDDESVQYMHDEYAEHDIEDECDIQQVLKENVNGSLTAHDEVEADFDGSSGQLAGSMHNVEDLFENSPPSQVQDMETDSKDECTNENKWGQVRKGTKIIVQVVKEGLGTKGPTLTAYPKLRSRFWILNTRCNSIGISRKISGVERTRLRVIAKTLQPQGFGLTVRTVAACRSLDELQKDLEGLLSTWKDIMDHAKSAALAADEGVEGAIPVLLHRAMGQTLCVVQDYFSDKVKSLVVDSSRTYHEVTNYLQEIAPDLCDQVQLYKKRTPLFDEYEIEEEINNILSKRVPLTNGGYLVIEQTEALVSIDVNGGQCMLGQGRSQETAILDVNLAAARQIARELRLRDIGGIIVVDFIDMMDDANKRLVYEEVKKAVERDRSTVKVSELSRHGLMEITRKRVRPSVTFMISEPCTCCHATGRVEALETSFSKIEHEICRLLAMMSQKPDPQNPKSWPRFMLWVDRYMCNYLTSGKRTRLAVLSSSLKVWILLKVARGFTRGAFEVKPLTDDEAYGSQHQVAISMLQPTEVGSYAPSRKLTVFPIKKWRTARK